MVIVTGAGGGLGRAYALDLASRGYRVLVNNRRREVDVNGQGSAQRVVAQIRARGAEAVANESDVADSASGFSMVQQALQTWGRLDALVANAGVEQHQSFHKISIADFQTIFQINFFGTLYVTHAAFAHMRERGHGRIVVSTSSAGLHGLHGLSAYAASKAALIGLARSLAAEGRSKDVRVNAVAPYAATRMTAQNGDPQQLAALRPEYLGPLIAYLISPDCTLSGQILIAGGARIRRAAMVEMPGFACVDPGSVTPQDVGLRLRASGTLDGAREFDDAMQAFGDFMRPLPPGA